MIPAVFLATICLGVILAAPTPDCNLDAEGEERKRSYENTYSPVRNMDTQRGSL